MPNITIDLLGQPNLRSGAAIVEVMGSGKDKFGGAKRLGLLAWFYGADPRASTLRLWKLVADAAVKAGVIDNGNLIAYGSFERCDVDGEGNPFPGQPCTRVIVGDWP